MIYIHVPFCHSFCTYCDFYSELCSARDSQQVQSRYLSSLLREIETRREEIRLARSGYEGQPDTLYLGGGTPSVLSPDAIGAILRAIAEASGREKPYEEFTMEVNPDDITSKGEEYVCKLRDIGVNRVSMGIQSFSDSLLKWMNRRHNADDAVRAVQIIREAGIKNLSIDLIFGVSPDGWGDTISKALALQPEHVSAYALSIEDGSALSDMVADGRYVPMDDSLYHLQYNELCAELTAAGYHHYEISNFAVPGKEAVHNSAYWQRVPYVGLGPGAHSFIKVGGCERRCWNAQQQESWSVMNGEEIIDANGAITERIMLSLRTDTGMSLSELEAVCGEGKVQKMLGDGLLEIHSPSHIPYVRIPERHWFVSDSIISDLLA